MSNSKKQTSRPLLSQFGIPLERTLANGGSGADEDMMRGNTLEAILANRGHEELSGVEQNNTIYFTQKSFAAGILEAMEHYDFLGACKAPDISENDQEETQNTGKQSEPVR